MEYVVWGRKPEAEEWEEQLLKSEIGSYATAQDWKRYAEQKGFVAVRISTLDLTVPPDFTKTIA